MMDVNKDGRAFKLATDRGLVIYTSQLEEDLLILKWMQDMIRDGEFLDVFQEDSQAISQFFEIFSAPNVLLYKTDEENTRIRYAAWFCPAWFGAWGGIWVEKEMRGTHYGEESFMLGQAVMAVGFSLFKMLAGFTSNESFLEKNADRWYINMGKMPCQMNGQDKWLLFYTKELFENGPFNPFK